MFRNRWNGLRPAVLFLALGLAGGAPAYAADSEFPAWGSIKVKRANMRVGPGLEYRVNWIYQRPGLPVKILRAIGGWWLVEDPDGARGWLRQSFVGRQRTGMVRGEVAELHEESDGSGRILWRVAPGVIGKLDKCSDTNCRFSVIGGPDETRAGYVARGSVWGGADFAAK